MRTRARPLLATFVLIRVAAGIYERSILHVGAPISLRSAHAAGLLLTLFHRYGRRHPPTPQ